MATLGQIVHYVDREGDEHAAIVIGPKSLNRVHLCVFPIFTEEMYPVMFAEYDKEKHPETWHEVED